MHKPCTIRWADDKCEGAGSSEEDQDNSGGETELPEIDPRAEDRELKNHLLKKYSGYLSSLKQELSKKKKKGKLPKDARQKLLNWWELHYKWPYPSVCFIWYHRYMSEERLPNTILFIRNYFQDHHGANQNLTVYLIKIGRNHEYLVVPGYVIFFLDWELRYC